MKYRSKAHQIEAVQLNGYHMSIVSADGYTVKVYSTMHGAHLRRKKAVESQQPAQPIQSGSWIITEPAFRVLSNLEFHQQFEAITEGV